MKILVLLTSALLLVVMIPWASAGDKPDAKMMKEKYKQKVAQMKTSGASQEDIDAFTADFKKKVVAMNNGLVSSPPNEMAFMEKVNMKAQDMKAAGASDDEINKMVAEAKKKWAEMNTKADKEGKITLSQKIE